MKKKFLLSILTVLFALCMGAFGACSSNLPPIVLDGAEENQQTAVVAFSDTTYTVNLYSNITLNPNYKGTDELTWTSKNDAILVVEDGIVFGKAVGAAEVTVSVGEESATCTVVVAQTNAYPTLSLAQSEMDIAKTAKKTITPTITSNDGVVLSNKFVNFEFKSLDTSVLTVDANGVITGVAVGNADIEVTAKFSTLELTKTFNVVVHENVIMSFDKTKASIFSNSVKGAYATQEQLNLFVYSDNELLDNPAVTYTVDDSSVVSVSSTGLATGISKGLTTVHAKYVTESGYEVVADINVEVSYPILPFTEDLVLEVFAEDNDTVDVSAFAEYFEEPLSTIEVVDDLGVTSNATISDGVVTLTNRQLSYGFRKLNFILNGELQVQADAEIVTKFISTPQEMGSFAQEYGGRESSCPGCRAGATGNYEGYFKLANDIDMMGQYIKYCVGHDMATYAAVDSTLGFKGIFDGQGYTIYNANDDLFSRVSSDAVIKNLGIVSEETMNSGAIASLFSGTLENVYINVNMSKYIDATGAIAFRSLGYATLRNVVVELPAIHNEIVMSGTTPLGKQASLFFDSKIKFKAENLFLITPLGTEQLFSSVGASQSGSFDGKLNHFSATSDNKDFSELDKSSMMWTLVGDVYRFTTSARWLLPILDTPDVANFAVDAEGTLTWDAIEGATGYLVSIDGVEQITETNSLANIQNGSSIKIRALGDEDFRDSHYSDAYFHVKLEEGILADFNYVGYEELFEMENPSAFASFDVEYLESYMGNTGVVKVSGEAVSTAKIMLKLPQAMTATKTGTISSGGVPVKEPLLDENGEQIKNEAGQPQFSDTLRIFDMTDLLIEMYVANPGTSTFGMFQNKYLDHKGDPADAGWGDQNFKPTVGSWFIHSNEKVTADHVRFGIGAGKFEFYLGGIEQGVIADKIVSDVSGNELASFKSIYWTGAVKRDQTPTYGDKALVEIGEFLGKSNVMKLTSPNVNQNTTATLTLPKYPTQTEITIQVYIVGGEKVMEGDQVIKNGSRFGLYKQEGGGWDDITGGANHSDAYARGEWITLVMKEIDNTGKYNFLRFGWEKGIEAVYIAGIWDGDLTTPEQQG